MMVLKNFMLSYIINIMKFKLLLCLFLFTYANALDKCDIKYAISNNILGDIVYTADSLGLYDRLKLKSDCSLSIIKFDNYFRVINGLINNRYDYVNTTTFDQMTSFGNILPTTTVLLQGKSTNNEIIVSNHFKDLESLLGEDIYMVENSYHEQYFYELVTRQGYKPTKDFNIKYVDLDSTLLSMYSIDRIQTIVTDRSRVLNLNKNIDVNIIDVDNSMSTVHHVVVRSTKNNLDDKLIRNIWYKTSSILKRGAGSEYSLLINALSKKYSLTFKETKNLVNSIKYFGVEDSKVYLVNKLANLLKESFRAARKYNLFYSTEPVSYNLVGTDSNENVEDSIFFNID